MVDFRAIIENLENIHFYDVFLPFILVYAVVFAILEKSGIFVKKDGSGNEKDASQTKNVNAVIAFVFGLFVVASIQTVMYIQNLITNIIVFIIFILVVLILLGFIFGQDYIQLLKENEKLRAPLMWIIGIIVILVALGVLIYVLGVWDFLINWWNNLSLGNSDDWVTFIVIVGIGFVIYWISKSSDNQKPNKSEDK